MCASEPAAEKYKRVCEYFPNFTVLTKSATLGKIQLTFGHLAVGNKSLEESVVAFALAGDISSPSVISLKIEIAFAADGNKSVSQLWKSSFVPPPANYHAQIIRVTELHATPSSYSHISGKP